MRRAATFICTLAFAATATAAYRIQAEVAGLADSAVYLARYYGSSRNMLDSSRFDAHGSVIFSSSSNTLPGGLYMLFSANQEMEFLVPDNADFSLDISAQMPNPKQSIVYRNSPLNEGFKRFVEARTTQIAIMYELHQRYQRYLNNPDSVATMQRAEALLQQDLQRYSEQLMQEYSGTVLATLIRSTIEPERPKLPSIPQMLVNPQLRAEQDYATFAKYHFFDNINFSDPSTVYMPMLAYRLDSYCKQVIARNNADTINSRLDDLLAKALANKLVYRFTLSHLYDIYKSAAVEGEYLTAIHLGNVMLASPAADWLSAAEREQIARNVKQLAMNPVGATATNLMLQTPAGEPVALRGVRAPVTVLMFYNPGCSSCRRQTPVVHEQYLRFKPRGLKVFAVYPDRDVSEWKKYIADNHYDDWINAWDAEGTANIYEHYSLHAIPQIYVLNKDKKILYKDIDAHELAGILEAVFARLQ